MFPTMKLCLTVEPGDTRHLEKPWSVLIRKRKEVDLSDVGDSLKAQIFPRESQGDRQPVSGYHGVTPTGKEG